MWRLLEPCRNIKRKKMNVNRNVTESIVHCIGKYCVAVLLNVKKNEKREMKRISWTPAMTQLSPRQHQILTLARATGTVQVDDLAERFDVGLANIRKKAREEGWTRKHHALATDARYWMS